MKKQEIFLVGGLCALVIVLSGCSAPGDVKKPEAQQQNASVEAQKPGTDKSQTTGVPAAKNELPETVKSQPGGTVDEEISNIDNDLKSIDDASLSSGMTDKELGL